MRFDQARSYLEEIPSYADSACFTGGEPLLYFREIVKLTELAKELGLRVSVVTGAGWVRSEEEARRRTSSLAQAGLDTLAISWDVYHEACSAPERAVVLARAAVDAGLAVTVRTVRAATAEGSQYRAAFGDLPIHFETGHLTGLGRAATLPGEHFIQQSHPMMGPCAVVLSPLIDYDGKVYACCGPSFYSGPHSPLMLGNAEHEPLGQILDRAARDPILETIALLGPYGLYLLLKESESSDLYTERATYTSICDLCLDLTNSSGIVSVLRARLADRDTTALATAAKLMIGERQQLQRRRFAE